MSIPNTLTIFINTRIRNYPKIRYEPSMTIPNTKSETVYFDPLIKLYSSIVKKIPPGYKETEKYTQFFNKNEFTSLINRTLSNSFQKKTNLLDATKNKTIDNNIRITLDQLFAPNTLFYIKGQPYTIFSYDWKNGDWKIDTKSFEKKFPYIPYGSSINYSLYKQPDGRFEQAEAKNELKRLELMNPEIISGPMSKNANSKFNESESSEILPLVENAEKKALVEGREEINKKISEELPKKFQNLIVRDNVQQESINSNNNEPNILSDPTLLTLLYPNNRNYLDDIKLNETVLGPLYNNVLVSLEKYNQSNNKYNEMIGTNNPNVSNSEVGLGVGGGVEPSNKNLLSLQKDYEEFIDILNGYIIEFKKTGHDINNQVNLKNEFIKNIKEFIQKKNQILTMYNTCFEVLLEKIKSQMSFVEKNKLFYEKLLETKINAENKYKKDNLQNFKIEVIKKIFNLDISCYKDILLIDNSVLEKEIQEISKKIKEIQTEIINYKELLDLYIEYPDLLTIQKREMNINIFELFEYNESYESKIWTILFDKTQDFFLNNIKQFSLENIKKNKDLLLKYNETYSVDQRENLENIIHNNKSLQKQSILSLKFIQSDPFKKQKVDYEKLMDSIILSYDSITLYSRFAVIYCAREIGLLTTKLNQTNIQKNKFSEMENYYKTLSKNKDSIKYLNKALFWNIKANIIEIEIEHIIIQINNDYETVKNNKKFFKVELTNLEYRYREIIDMLIPELSSNGVNDICKNILNNEDTYENDEENVLTQNEKLYKGLFNVLMKYEKPQFDFVNELIQLFYSTNYFENMEKNKLFHEMNQWKIYGMDSNEDSLFAAISIAFNGELIVNGKKSNNKYSVNGYYSINSIKQSIEQKEKDIIDTLENIFKINIIVVEKIDDNDDLFVGLPVNFKENNQNEHKYGIIEKINTANLTCNISSSDKKQYENISINNINAIEPYYRVKPITSNHDHSIFVILDNGSYQLLYTESKFIFSFDEIPEYMKYFIYVTSIKYSYQIKQSLTEFEKKIVDSLKKSGNLEQSGGMEQEGGFQKNEYRNFRSMNQHHSKESKLSYYVVIDLELYPGNEGVPLSQKAVLSCDKQYEKIRHAFADVFGLNYRPKEFIALGYKPKEKGKEGKEGKEGKQGKKTRRYKKYYNRKTINRRKS
jgi:hypothetical protein